jgi:hypothetical protein
LDSGFKNVWPLGVSGLFSNSDTSPQIISLPGYHLQFITLDWSAGGHLPDFKPENARVLVDTLSELDLAFPENEESYQADLTEDASSSDESGKQSEEVAKSYFSPLGERWAAKGQVFILLNGNIYVPGSPLRRASCGFERVQRT